MKDSTKKALGIGAGLLVVSGLVIALTHKAEAVEPPLPPPLPPPPPPPGNFNLTLNVSGAGNTNPAPGTHEIAAGTTVIMAIPAVGWHFTGWTGLVNSLTTKVTTVLMNANKTVTANFAQDVVIPPPIAHRFKVGDIFYISGPLKCIVADVILDVTAYNQNLPGTNLTEPSYLVWLYDWYMIAPANQYQPAQYVWRASGSIYLPISSTDLNALSNSPIGVP